MMTPKMVAHFRRSVSFSNTPSPPPQPSSSATRITNKRFHFRSTSLPTRSHPTLYQLKFHLNQLKSQWTSDFEPELSSSVNSGKISDALIRLRTILESLDDLLDLAPSRDSLRRHPDWVEKVLEDFLVMVDVYGTFLMQISTLKQCSVAAQLATRRRKDGLKTLDCCLKGLKKSGREIFKLMPFIQTIRAEHDHYNPIIGSSSSLDVNLDPDLDIVGVIKDVIQVIITISEAIFGGISESFDRSPRKSSWRMMAGLKKPSKIGDKGIKELENGVCSLRNNYKMMSGLLLVNNNNLNIKKMMDEMDECIDGIENGSEKVFRSLINTRVSLLNVLTQ